MTADSTIEPLDRTRHVAPGVGPHANVLDALFDLICTVPESPPVQFTELAEISGAEDGDKRAPFFTEAYLYPLLGKDDARTMLTRLRHVFEALGVSDGAAMSLMYEEFARRWFGTLRVTFVDQATRDRFLEHLKADVRYERVKRLWRGHVDGAFIDFRDLDTADRTLVEALVKGFGAGEVAVRQARYRTVWRPGLSFRANAETYRGRLTRDAVLGLDLTVDEE